MDTVMGVDRWSETRTYAPGDIVYQVGSFWVALRESAGVSPWDKPGSPWATCQHPDWPSELSYKVNGVEVRI